MQNPLPKQKVYRGQILILAVVIILLFIFAATALIDVYHLEEARNWGYRVAQDAATAGASYSTTRWVFFQPTVDPLADTPTPRPDGCMDSLPIQLNKDEAKSAATDMLTHEMGLRGFVPADYEYNIQVLPDVGGGTVVNYPTVPVRLGASRGNWSATHAAVGVYISFRVHTFMMSIVGRDSVEVHVFAAAEVSPPVECP
ncbi:MAG: hypothetical protein ABSC61_04690 [Anaerolineales bacterium]